MLRFQFAPLVSIAIVCIALTSCDNHEATPASRDDSSARSDVGAAQSVDTTTMLPHGNIRVDVPRPGAIISGTRFTLTGVARTFENNVAYRVLTRDDAVLIEGKTTSEGEMDRYNPYQADVQVPAAYVGPAMLEVFQYSARDGSMTDVVHVPIQLRGDSTQVTRLTVYFTRSDSTAAVMNCDSVYPVVRGVEKTMGVAQAAIEELLNGPTSQEQEQGFSTQIPSTARLLNVVVANGLARADFSDDLDRIAGSCRVTAARRQIEQTLRQFPTVDSVRITVDGRAKGVLQP